MYIKNNTADQKIIIQANKTTAGDLLQVQNTNGNTDLLRISNTGVLTTVTQAISGSSLVDNTITQSQLSTSFINQDLTTTSVPTFANIISTNGPTIGSHLATKTYVDSLTFGGGGSVNPMAIVDATPYTIATSDLYFGVRTNTLAITVNLPSDALRVNGRIYKIYDLDQNAAINNITINGNGKNILNSPSLIIDINAQGVQLMFNSTVDKWIIL